MCAWDTNAKSEGIYLVGSSEILVLSVRMTIQELSKVTKVCKKDLNHNLWHYFNI